MVARFGSALVLAFALTGCPGGSSGDAVSAAGGGADVGGAGGGGAGGDGAGVGGAGGDGAGGAGAGGGGAGGAGGAGGSPVCVGNEDCDDGVDCTEDVCFDNECVSTPSDNNCDDGLYCNGDETCDLQLGCQQGAEPCDDGIGCTVDACDEGADSCSATPDDVACDDTVFCNGVEVCDPPNGDPTTGCDSAATSACDDSIACTVDSCEEGTQACTNAPDDGLCDDTFFCNGVEICDPMTGDMMTGCAPPIAPACDDGIGCTLDACDDTLDTCSAPPDDMTCDDGAFCNGVETCDPATGDPVTGCLDALAPACEDGIDCTDDSCDENQDMCTNAPNDMFCDDGLFCTGTEFCDVVNGQCATTGATDCDDGVMCTTDFCDTMNDVCANVAVDANCADGQFCNGNETCDVINDCQPGVAPNCSDSIDCTDDSCDETNDVCVSTVDDGNCDDTVFCNGSEVCVAGVGCQAGTPVTCDDGLDCTSGSCDTGLDACVFAANDGFCDDGLLCNGSETCDVSAASPGDGCVAGNTVMCSDDGIACTVETCDESAMGCISTADNSLCPAGEFCVPALAGCVPSSPCTLNSECDDGDDCNGIETCNVVCQAGTPVDCNDGVGCTVDSCNPSDGSCTNATSDAQCDDGFACNGAETCDAVMDCQTGTPVDCNDGVGCTIDVCLEPSGTCGNSPSNSLCDDGVFCNGAETCDAAMDCQTGSAPNCDDNIACTVDGCDLMADSCIYVPDSSLCACGETCEPGLGGCGNHCIVTECQGKVYECGDCTDNDSDCGIDVGGDDLCFGVCDNNEAGLKGEIPGQNSAPCKQDCYFDGDTGAGNDDCYWSHKCDTNEVAPDFYPEGPSCAYDPAANIPGTNQSCAQLQAAQSQAWLDFCGPLTPNGCDCFGCCEVPGAATPIWLGSEDGSGNGTCTLADAADPTKCAPCDIVQSCFNTCENCEICIGKPVLPPECTCQECPPNVQLCGPPCGTPCPAGSFCNNGCCAASPS